MLDGKVPYLDFGVEYPPAALPVFVLPAIGDGHDQRTYKRNFERLMVLCGLLAIAGLALALSALRADPDRLLAALGFAALAPLALGSVILTRFDLWPTALLMLGLAGVLAERWRRSRRSCRLSFCWACGSRSRAVRRRRSGSSATRPPA